KVRFKILSSGVTIERTYDPTNQEVDLKISGETYTFKNASSDLVNDFDIILVSGGTSRVVNTTAGSSSGKTVSLYTEFGAIIKISDADSSLGNYTNDLSITVETIDDDLIDDFVTVPELIIDYDITAFGDEVDLNRNDGVELEEDPDDDDATDKKRQHGENAFCDSLNHFSPSMWPA
ncbi:MAG: hypothetical protein IID46_04985, partial [Planctomycetes bacterium]|nr:hypothetical protein [Planctomycetota bacterium]